MIVRLYPTKDTFITNAQRAGVQQTGSNFGGSEVLDLFKVAGTSGALGTRATASISRLLMQFDLSLISELTSSGRAPTSGISYTLRLHDARHAGTVPTSYSALVAPLTRRWDEGTGIDNDSFRDSGFACWTHAQAGVPWTTPGGDLSLAVTSSYHFDSGLEDLQSDVTQVVNAWLTGGLDNHGVIVMLSGAAETDYSDLYAKKFHGRATNYRDQRPYIEARWDDSLRDDRNDVLFGSSSSLYMYNVRGGQLTNLAIGENTLIVSIADASGTLMFATGSFTGVTGIYSASIVLPTGSYSGSVFYDRWGSGSYSFMTGAFYPRNEQAVTSIGPKRYVSHIKNMRTEYETSERVRFDLFVRTHQYNPPIVHTASYDIRPTIVRKGYYRIDNDMTKEQVVPFGTGTVESTRMSYDANGNYFNFYMSTLTPGNVYRIVFLFDVDGERQVVDEGMRFRVV